ncbi:MAG: PDZ domain-containing protein [Parcubacteria group bacterium]|nr:PDZ domain-containing protein [Parcubacteria group bacterium]
MKNKFLSIILLSVIMGTLAGVLSGSIVYNYLFSYMDMGGIMSGIKDSGRVVSSPRIINEETRRAVDSSLVTFYSKKSVGGTVADNIYLEGDKLGYGVIITSDGWVVTSSNVLGDSTRVAVVTSDGKSYSITNTESDLKNNIVFVRLDATNLNPVAFGDSRDLSLGEDLYLFDDVGRVKKLSSRGLGYESLLYKSSLFLSSENLEKSLFFEEEVSSDFGGAPLINFRGEVVGIVKDEGTSKISEAIPFHHVRASMQNLFKGGKISKLFLGVQYIDLAHVVSSETNIETRGAIITTGGGGIGVLTYSPAWDAGLEEGDIIIKIGNDDLNEEYNLSERIAEYSSGDKIDFIVLRDGEEKILEVELGELR